MLITDVECVNSTGTPLSETGDVAFCNVTHGLRCFNHDNWFLNSTCDNYKVRFFCSCPGDVAYCNTTDGLRCFNHDNWYTDQQCDNYKVRFYCDCPTETTTQPETTAAPSCVPHWTQFFDEHTPTVGQNGLETETLQDLKNKYLICHGQEITDVECLDNNGTSFTDTGDVAYCNTTHGLRCYNSDNWYTEDQECSNYRVRFQCGCPITPEPPCGPYWTEFFDESTPTVGQNGLETETLQDLRTREGSVDVTTNVDLLESLIPTAYSRIMGDEWLNTVIKDEMPPDRYEYLIGIDTARRKLDEEHGHVHTLHYAMQHCGDFIPGCYPKELCLTWENETNCRCFNGFVSRGGHDCIHIHTSTPPPERCEPYWTPFFNTNSTTDGEYGGDMELLANIRQNYSICDDDKITDIMCRKAGTNETAEELGQTVLCNITTGLIGLRCFNNDNLDTDAGQCEDYEVSYKCGCDIEIVTSILSSRLVGIEWSEVFRDITSWEYKEVKKYYMRITHAMMEGIDGIFSMTFVGIEPGSIIVSVEINSTRAAVNLLRYRSLELIDDFHMIPEDMANGNQSIWELMGDECTDQMDGLHEGCTPVETCFLHHHGEYRCRCHSGFIENENKTKCMDVNECEMAIDDCSVYNKTCTNTIGSFSCNCPDGLWWNTTSASCGEPPKHKWVNTRINGTSQPQQQCPDCGLGTCEYNDTNGIPFCRCPDGSTGDNCDSAVAEAGSLAALAALAAIIPCCCCLAILAARKKHKKRKLLYSSLSDPSSPGCPQ
uniref:EGF-like domain-containing protein n=1 Tax=Branchiostoma floridae TaxID=7739 RepID=C3YBX7_BRAFL|eukprot:XP_002606142.1 hypothetical protein BRAFLDRAFT_102741 [Branchiostoma floridae]